MLRLLLASALLLPLAACDSGVDENVDVPSGTYTEFGVRHLRDGEVVFEGLAGVYFQRSFRFGTDGTFEVEVVSDFAPEEGRAQGRYEAGDGLQLRIESSTTSYYSVGDIVTYEGVKVVDGSHRTAFAIGGGEAKFRGPGLILAAEQEDADGFDGVTETYLRRTGTDL